MNERENNMTPRCQSRFRAYQRLTAAGKKIACEEGTALVEIGLSAIVVLMVLFGIFQAGYLLYTYNYVCNAARDASRYAAIRGPNSCNDATNQPFPDCGLSPSKFTSTTDPTQNPLLKYVEGMGYPGLSSSNESMQVKFLVATKTSTGTTTWAEDANCNNGSDTDSNANACNNVGNIIQVKVIYNFPLNIPFWRSATIPVGSVSSMMISE